MSGKERVGLVAIVHTRSYLLFFVHPIPYTAGIGLRRSTGDWAAWGGGLSKSIFNYLVHPTTTTPQHVVLACYSMVGDRTGQLVEEAVFQMSLAKSRVFSIAILLL